MPLFWIHNQTLKNPPFHSKIYFYWWLMGSVQVHLRGRPWAARCLFPFFEQVNANKYIRLYFILTQSDIGRFEHFSFGYCPKRKQEGVFTKNVADFREGGNISFTNKVGHKCLICTKVSTQINDLTTTFYIREKKKTIF